MDYLVSLLASFLAVMVVITLHEFSHAFIAYKCGDPTAKWAGRMTLNPVKHFDPLGIVMFALAGFGWAKPVPVNPNNFKHYRSGSFWTSAAGIIMNYFRVFVLSHLSSGLEISCGGRRGGDLRARVVEFVYLLFVCLFFELLYFQSSSFLSARRLPHGRCSE